MIETEHLSYEVVGTTAVVTMNRPEAKNSLSGPMLVGMVDAWTEIDANDDIRCAILTGAGGTFCSGMDLKSMSGPGNEEVSARMAADPDLHWKALLRHHQLRKPLIAAVEGYAVAGGLELAVWCDLRVAASDAVFGVFCRRWGVPLVDGGTIRLPRLIGQSHANDLILTGRGVSGDEAVAMGLVNRSVTPGTALAAAVELATEIASLPQVCLRNDRRSSYEQWGLDERAALGRETELGLATLSSPETLEGVTRFASGAGRHGV